MQRFLGGEIVVVGNAGFLGYSTPSIFELPEGGWISSWFDYDPTQVTRQQRFDQNGNKVGDLTTIANHGYVMVGLANGGWVIGTKVGSFDANISLYGADGTLLVSQLQVNSGNIEYDSLPPIAGLANGGWIVTWAGYPTDGDPDYEPDVYQQRYSASGVALGPNQRVNTTDAFEHRFASVTALSDGGWIVAWGGGETDASGGSSQNVLLRRYDKDGNAVGGEVRVSDPDKQTRVAPSITELEDGGWVVAWWEGEGTRMYQQRFDNDGNAVGEQVSLNYNAISPPQVDALADGGWMMSYFSYFGNEHELHVQAFAADGEAVGGKVVVDIDSSYASHTIEALDDGRFFVTFVSGSEVRQQIFSMGENAVPFSTDDHGAMDESDFLYVDVLANDTDGDGDRLTIESATVVRGSATVMIAFGQLLVSDESHHLTKGDTGTLVIEYTTTDGFETDTGQVTIEVSGRRSNGDLIRGDQRSNHFQGTNFAEIYFGRGGNDVIIGKGGNDLLLGSHGKDHIEGNGGVDTIVGGRGNDELSGGAERDIFVFYKGDGRDEVRFGGYVRDIINVADFGFDSFKEVKQCIEYRHGDMIIDLPGSDKITVIDGASSGAYFAY